MLAIIVTELVLHMDNIVTVLAIKTYRVILIRTLIGAISDF